MYLVPQNNHVLVIALAQNMASAIQKLEFVIVRKDILEKIVEVINSELMYTKPH